PDHDQSDRDHDGVGDACEPAACPPPAGCPPAAADARPGGGAAGPGDRDGDGIPDVSDNCPDAPNANQQDTDGDGIGDACDLDMDGDGVLTPLCGGVAWTGPARQAPCAAAGVAYDDCPLAPNPGQRDSLGDGRGDACRTQPARSAPAAHRTLAPQSTQQAPSAL